MTMIWEGIMPAITTPFGEDGEVDHEFLVDHARWMIERSEATAIIPLGSLGEGATLDGPEKHAIIRGLVEGLADTPVVPGIAAASTRQAVALARFAEQAGCGGLMVLPPYVHHGDEVETREHMAAVLRATSLPCLLYNNPTAYGADVRPETIAALADAHPNLRAVKESSGDVRRITAIRARVGERLAVLVGLDDLVVEGVRAGATGWVAGVVNALPEDSARLLALARAAEDEPPDALYRRLLPLLRMDTVPEFVQLIKLMQREVGRGHERVRPPRLPLPAPARQRALDIIRTALGSG